MENCKIYICVCGKEFYNPQKFNYHKSRCKEHMLQKYGNLSKLEETEIKRKKSFSATCKIKKKNLIENNLKKKEDFLQNWISEQHECESCGKIMTEYFGSGRFCSRSCANKHKYSQETKHKISTSLIKAFNEGISDIDCENIYKEIKNKKENRKQRQRICYDGPEIDPVESEKLKPGYQPRSRIPYSEKFWMRVLDNNNISYEHDVSVWKPGYNNYYLDFLIDNKYDIEIDGSFHLDEDILKKDIIRTKYLEDNGYIVYRIKWINPNTASNKILVNKQIDDLLKFIGKKRIV